MSLMEVNYWFMPKKGFGGPFMDFFGATAGNQIYISYLCDLEISPSDSKS